MQCDDAEPLHFTIHRTPHPEQLGPYMTIRSSRALRYSSDDRKLRMLLYIAWVNCSSAQPTPYIDVTLHRAEIW